ncbi:MAG: hypothetical protein AB7V56_13795 [Candidatus Nitrosocosmicus sp.]
MFAISSETVQAKQKTTDKKDGCRKVLRRLYGFYRLYRRTIHTKTKGQGKKEEILLLRQEEEAHGQDLYTDNQKRLIIQNKTYTER